MLCNDLTCFDALELLREMVISGSITDLGHYNKAVSLVNDLLIPANKEGEEEEECCLSAEKIVMLRALGT